MKSRQRASFTANQPSSAILRSATVCISVACPIPTQCRLQESSKRFTVPGLAAGLTEFLSRLKRFESSRGVGGIDSTSLVSPLTDIESSKSSSRWLCFDLRGKVWARYRTISDHCRVGGYHVEHLGAKGAHANHLKCYPRLIATTPVRACVGRSFPHGVHTDRTIHWYVDRPSLL